MARPSTQELNTYLAQGRAAVDEALDRTLPAADVAPAALHAAMRYALLSPGKRLRGIVVLATTEMLKGSPDNDTARYALQDAWEALRLQVEHFAPEDLTAGSTVP